MSGDSAGHYLVRINVVWKVGQIPYSGNQRYEDQASDYYDLPSRRWREMRLIDTIGF
jgi:hypothetical protein